MIGTYLGVVMLVSMFMMFIWKTDTIINVIFKMVWTVLTVWSTYLLALQLGLIVVSETAAKWF